MTAKEIIKVIEKNALTVRCLPFETVNYWSGYKEGDENRKYVDSNGKEIIAKREVVIQHFDLEYFQKAMAAPSKYTTTDTPEKRWERWKKNFPNGRKLLKETKIVEKGGWWYVKETPNTSSTVRFDRRYDKFFAPTLEKAVQLYLKSKE